MEEKTKDVVRQEQTRPPQPPPPPNGVETKGNK